MIEIKKVLFFGNFLCLVLNKEKSINSENNHFFFYISSNKL